MGNIRNRFTELIPKTRQYYRPVVPHFEAFYGSVLKIKESTPEIYSPSFSLHSTNQYPIYQMGMGWEDQLSF